jgi:hypothetical protein
MSGRINNYWLQEENKAVPLHNSLYNLSLYLLNRRVYRSCFWSNHLQPEILVLHRLHEDYGEQRAAVLRKPTRNHAQIDEPKRLDPVQIPKPARYSRTLSPSKNCGELGTFVLI